MGLRPQAAGEEIGADCRVMSAAEKLAFEQRLAALQAVLPVPDPARYARSSLQNFVDSMTVPAISKLNTPDVLMTCRSWPAGCFPTDASCWLAYSRKEERAKTDKEAKDVVALAPGMMNEMRNQVQVSAWLKPHPHLVANVNGKCVDVEDVTARAIENTPTLLAYWTGDDEGANAYLILGPRTCKEVETLNVETPAKNVAPVVSVEIQITGPEAAIAPLVAKIDRQAVAALLGPLVR